MILGSSYRAYSNVFFSVPLGLLPITVILSVKIRCDALVKVEEEDCGLG